MIDCVAFDADDTLWENERFFQITLGEFQSRLADFADADHLAERLEAAERRNLAIYGYGIKGFLLSMVETAIEVTDARVPSSVIADLLTLGREMLSHPVNLIDGVKEVLECLAGQYRLMIITKGDLIDQERKIAASGLAQMFDGVEIVTQKDVATYRAVFTRQGCDPARAVMVGNSVGSDITPVLEAGGWAIHVPHDWVWSLDNETPPNEHERFRQVRGIALVPGVVAGLIRA